MLCFDRGSTMPAVSSVLQVVMFNLYNVWDLLVYLEVM